MSRPLSKMWIARTSRERGRLSGPDLRQVHLIHTELHDELHEQGFIVEAGHMGENITTRGLDVLALPRGTVLRLEPHAVVEVTGLRNPCNQINNSRPGLLKAVLDQDEHGRLVREAGIMGIVRRGGPIKTGDTIHVELPEQPHLSLDRV